MDNPKKFVCRMGHEFDPPEAEFDVQLSSGPLTESVGRLCITCLSAFLSKTFGLREKVY